MEIVIQTVKRYPGNPDAVAILTAGMNSDKADIRNRAASGVFDTKNRKIALVVQEILDNPQSKMRVYDILNSISFRNMAKEHVQWAEKTLESAASSRDNKIFSMLILLGNWKSKYSPLIIKYVNSPDLWLRSNALLVLGEKDFNAFKEYIPALTAAREPLLRKIYPQVIQYFNQRNSYSERKVLFDAEHSASFDPPNEYSSRDKKLELDPDAVAALQKLAQDINPEVRSEAFFAMLVQDVNFDFKDFARTLDAITDRTELSSRIYTFFDDNERKLKPEFQGLLAYLNSADKARWERKIAEARKDSEPADVEPVQTQTAQTPAAAVSANPAVAEKKQTEPVAASKKKLRIPLVYFYKNGCDDCRNISEILETLPESFPELDVIKYNIEKIDALKLNEAYCEKFQVPEKIRLVAPSVFTANGCLIKDQIYVGKLKRLISSSATAGDGWLIIPQKQTQEIVKSEKRIEARYKTISFWLIVSSGFFDGINPCAFATIIFFISYLAVAGRGKKQILQVGAAFAAGTFVAYYLMGMGLAELLNQIVILKTIGKWVNLSMAVLVLFFAVLNIYDGILCLKGKLESMTLQLPAFLKERIHWSIRTGARSRRFVIAAFIVGMVVSVIELACTGQVYAPVIYYIIQTGINRTGAMLYLGLYNLAFILPLVIIILLAYIGVRSEALSVLLKRNAALVKFSTALLFLILFFFLLSAF
jgi:cytochrome c biogenesis protein CcdA